MPYYQVTELHCLLPFLRAALIFPSHLPSLRSCWSPLIGLFFTREFKMRRHTCSERRWGEVASNDLESKDSG